MKNIPCAYLFCAVALLGLPLVSASAAAAADENASAPVVKKSDAPGDGLQAGSATTAPQADKEKQPTAREAKHAADLARYDADKDGKLNAQERAAKKADAEKVRAEKKAAREARLTEKAAAAEAKKLARYDRNKDGKLDETELAVAKADEAKRLAASEKRKAARNTAKPVAETGADEGQAPESE